MEFEKKLQEIKLKREIDLALWRISMYTNDMKLLMQMKKISNETVTDNDIVKCLDNIKEQINKITKLQHQEFLNTIGGSL